MLGQPAAQLFSTEATSWRTSGASPKSLGFSLVPRLPPPESCGEGGRRRLCIRRPTPNRPNSYLSRVQGFFSMKTLWPVSSHPIYFLDPGSCLRAQTVSSLAHIAAISHVVQAAFAKGCREEAVVAGSRCHRGKLGQAFFFTARLKLVLGRKRVEHFRWRGKVLVA